MGKQSNDDEGKTLESSVLNELIRKIKEGHQEVQLFEKQTLEKKRDVGRFLNQIKSEVKRQGIRWEDWVKDTFPEIPPSSRRLYMQIGREWDQVPPEYRRTEDAFRKYLSQRNPPPENRPERWVTELELFPGQNNREPRLLEFERQWNALPTYLKQRFIGLLRHKPEVINLVESREELAGIGPYDGLSMGVERRLSRYLSDLNQEVEPQHTTFYYSGGMGQSIVEEQLQSEAHLMLTFYRSWETANGIEPRFQKLIDSRTHPDSPITFGKHFLDSGAFNLSKESFTPKQEHAYLEQYAAFIHQHQVAIDQYANLDVIFNPVKSWENQQALESLGLDPIPVVHFGTDISELQRYMDMGYEYIGLGLKHPIGTRENEFWLDHCFDLICDCPSRLPQVKVHGFAIGNLRYLRRYPWYSVDSTTWEYPATHGAISVPRRRKKDNETQWAWNLPHLKVHISDEKPDDPSHFDHLSQIDKEVVTDWLKEQGFELNEVKTNRENRIRANLGYYKEMVKTLTYPSPFLSTNPKN